MSGRLVNPGDIVVSSSTPLFCQPIPLDRGIRERECYELTGISRSYRWRLEQEGRFPRRRRTGLRCHYWLLSELMEWLKDPEAFATGASQRAS
ncbi:helix-turn-helix transcriptional regulator [Modicisalibacter luteus]|uniref:Helix-turn-helix transcriptional regulator n=1 Tax=Modicisalibacter luteus TaxID=453962 RepID=A0ABV7LY27_9GAMM